MYNKPSIYGPQPINPNEEPGNLGTAALGFGAVAGSGFLPYKNGRLWDKYVSGVRAAETAFPGAILRTFRIGEVLSPLESYSSIHVSPQQMAEGRKHTEFIKSIFGGGVDQITLKKNGFAFGTITGKGHKAIGEGLQILAGTQKGSTIADYYARLSGVNLDLEGVGGANITQSLNDSLMQVKHKASGTALPFGEWVDSLDPTDRQQRIIIGAKYRDSISIAGKSINLSPGAQKKVARAEVFSKLLRAKSATTAGRLNTLLRAPLELPVVGEAISKVPFLKSLAVKPGSTTKMLGGYIGKGLAVGAAWKGLEYVDYLRAEGNQMEATVSSTFAGGALGGFIGKNAGQRFNPKGFVIGAALGLAASIAPRFDNGIVPGLATMYGDAQVARAEVSEAIGLSDSLREQDKVAPDFSSLGTALGFAGVGGLTVGLGDFSHFVGSSIRQAHGRDEPLWSVFQRAREGRKDKVATAIWDSKLGKKLTKTKIGKSLSAIKHPMALGALGGLALWGGINALTGVMSGNFLAAIPGAGFLGTTETPEELEDIYSGRKEVAVRKGRWWEFGRATGYEGGRIEYFRQHNVARLKSRAYQKGLYGTEEERWDHDPLMNPMKALFGSDDWKYYYEKKHAQDRPAPLSGTYGEDIPFLGPLFAATIGNILKPRKMIREDEWSTGDGKYVAEPHAKYSSEPAYELGGLGPGAPVAPEEGTQLFNKLNYKRREAVGLIGFAEGALEGAITGREEVFQNQRTLATMGNETGSEAWLWKHMNVGGALGASEAIRRFIPRTPSYLDTYNPLRNSMPSWMPDDYFIDLKHGNPFDKINEAEIRLPGTGYAALNPEVEGLAPEQYPLMHRLKILSDVGMWSPEYRDTLDRAKNMKLSESHQVMLENIQDQVAQKKRRKEFSSYRFNEDTLTSQDVTVTNVVRPGVITTKEFGDTEIALQGVGGIQDSEGAFDFAESRLAGKRIQLQTPSLEGQAYNELGMMKGVAMIGGTDYGTLLAERGLATQGKLTGEFEQLGFSGLERVAGKIAETAMHGAETPFEMLTPMSPAAKLIRKRSAIEDYARTQAVGTGNAFWDKPIDNFLKPTIDMFKYNAGAGTVPENIRERRDMSEYFDMLKWVKGERLGDGRMKSTTLFGTDVFGKAPKHAMPRIDRDYFDEFVNAKTEEDRSKILSLVPENQHRIYTSQWLKQEETAAQAKVAAGRATESDNRTLVATAALRKSEGFAFSKDLEEQWMNETQGQIPYDEWVRQKKAAEYFSTHSLPGADWLGWHPSVDLEDVKMVKVGMEGHDYHDFDLWGGRERDLARKPYIDYEMMNEMNAQAKYDQVVKTSINANNLGKMFGDKRSNVQLSYVSEDLGEQYRIEVKDGRSNMINNAFARLGA